MIDNKFIHVEWNDAAHLAGYNKSDAKGVGLVKMVTVGILVHDRPTHIVVALTATETKDEFSEMLSIPKSQITNAQYLTFTNLDTLV